MQNSSLFISQYDKTHQQLVSISPFHNPKHRQDQAVAHTVRSREVGPCFRDYKIGLLQLVAFRSTQVPNQATSTGPKPCCESRDYYPPKYDHISHILEKLHWLPVEQRITYKICLLTYKSLNNMGPIYLKDLLHPYSPGHSGLRSADKSLLREPKFRYANFGRRAFARAAPHHWNSVIPLALRQCTSLGSFKKSLKCHLYIDAFN